MVEFKNLAARRDIKFPAWHAAIEPSLPGSADCHVWLWNIHEQKNRTIPVEMLSPEEIAIADRFIFKEDRAKYVHSHGMMRFILGQYLKCSPGDVEIAPGVSGKPVLLHASNGLHFSLSHASAYAVLAVARSAVGVDLEQPRAIDPSVAKLHFSRSEREQLAAYTGEEWTRCFFRCWTRKEAVLKAEGVGLSVPLTSFDVEIAHNQKPSLLRYRDDSGLTCHWKVEDISPSQEIVIALAVRPDIQELKLFDFDSEFASKA